MLAVFFRCCDQVRDKEPSKEGRAYFGSAVGISVHHSGEGMAAAQSPLPLARLHLLKVLLFSNSITSQGSRVQTRELMGDISHPDHSRS